MKAFCFWSRLTGDVQFYPEHVGLFLELFEKGNFRQILNLGIDGLATEVRQAYFVGDEFDPNRM